MPRPWHRSPRRKPTTSTNGDLLGELAWSRDGAILVAGGTAPAQFMGGNGAILCAGSTPPAERKGEDDRLSSDSSIRDMQPCGDGFAF